MGSPLGPVLANSFLGYHERSWLQEFDIGEVLLYTRYVDDILCIFKSVIAAENLFKYLSSKHPKFTMEKETNKFLPFLDVLVKDEGSTVHLLLHYIGRKRLLEFLRNIIFLQVLATKSVL